MVRPSCSRQRTDDDAGDRKPPPIPRSPPASTQTVGSSLTGGSHILRRANRTSTSTSEGSQPHGEWHRVTKGDSVSRPSDLVHRAPDEDTMRPPSAAQTRDYVLSAASTSVDSSNSPQHPEGWLAEKRYVADRKWQHHHDASPAVTPGAVAVGGRSSGDATRNCNVAAMPPTLTRQIDDGCPPLDVAKLKVAYPPAQDPRGGINNQSKKEQQGVSTSMKEYEEWDVPGAIPVPGLSATVTSSSLEQSMKSTSVVSGTIEVTANVVPDEEDIEAQVQARMDKEREEIAARVEERLIQGAIHADVMSEEEIQLDHDRKSRRIKLLLLGLFVLVVTIVVAVVVVFTKGGGDPPKCTLCADGSHPNDLESKEFIPGGDSVTCEDFRETQIALDLNEDACTQGQAAAWLYCDCPILPPYPEDPSCTQCLDGSDPYEIQGSSLNCTEWNIFLAHVGSSPFFECDALKSDQCRCKPEQDFVEYLTALFFPISGEALGVEGTPQNNALYWLDVLDPANLTEFTNTTELTQRYALAVLFFATGDSNNLDGKLPNELTALSGLRVIEFRSNNLVGSIPQDISKLSLLERFDVDLNSMTGSVAGFFDILHLRELWLDGNNFSGPLPTTLNSDLALASFTCDKCNLNGSLPENLGFLSSLRFVDLDNNNIVGSMPDFADNSPLEQLWIWENQLTGTLPSSLGGLSRLKYLDVHHNFLNGTIPPSLGKLPSLSGLDISDNRIVGRVPPFTGEQIVELRLYQNLLNGDLDNFFASSSTGLTLLWVHENELSGLVPETIGNFIQLEILDMEQNELSGQFPTTIGNLRALEYLNLNINSLTGSVPSELGLCTLLETLYFGVNDLSGTVPEELGRLVKLMSLGFARAGLEGSFPDGVAALPELEFLAVHGNNFNNDFNATFCTREDPIDQLFANCQVETVVCPCCTKCCDEFGLSCEP